MEGPLQGKVRAVGQQGLQPEGEENEDVDDKPFKESFGALVKNCNMLHNIVGPACIFLKQGFSQTLVCTYTPKCAHCVVTQPRCNFFHSFRVISLLSLWLTLPGARHRTSCSLPPLPLGHTIRRSNLLAPHTLKEVNRSLSWGNYWLALWSCTLKCLPRDDVEDRAGFPARLV